MRRIKLILTVVISVCGLQVNAQIGYQVSLLNSATGEPRSNETVRVEIEITDSKGKSICKEEQSTTTNDFGILSLQVGNANTFAEADWSQLPFFVSATVDGVMIGKSQILNVPVAEAAKTIIDVAPELICKTWKCVYYDSDARYKETLLTRVLSLTVNKTFTYEVSVSIGGCIGIDHFVLVGKYLTLGNVIHLYDVTETKEERLCGGDFYGINSRTYLYYKGSLMSLHSNEIFQ